MSVLDLVVGSLVMAFGAFLQGVVGFGSNLVGAPLLVLLDDDFVPGPIVLASVLISVLVARREGRGSIDPRIRGAIVGQVIGAVGAGAVLASLPERGLSLLFGGVVLAAVGLSLWGWHPKPTPGTLLGAGTASGFMGTVSGIGGPPIALVYQRSDGPTLRGTLARFFLVGASVSVPTLIVVGELGVDELVPTLALLPGIIVGFALSARLARRIDKGHARPVVLTLSAVSAAAVLVRELF